MPASVCRACLGSNIRMVYLENGKLKELYENLSGTKLNTHGERPTICYICHYLLQKCWRFADLACKSESTLKNLYSRSSEIQPKTATITDHGLMHNISVRPVQFLTLTDDDEDSLITVKIEQHEETEMEFDFFGIPETTGIKTAIDDDFIGIGIGDKREINDRFKTNEDLRDQRKEHDFIDENNSNEMINDNFVEVERNRIDDDIETDGTAKSVSTEVYCDYCNKKFLYKYRLMVHLRTHTNQKLNTYGCDRCREKFPDPLTLKFHKRNHRLGDKVQTFACKICDETFTTKVKLTTHILTHTGEFQYSCKACNKAFAKLADLKRHVTQAHTGNMHRCTVCEREFNKPISLKAHMLTHTAQKSHICNICDKAFSVSANLRRHLDTHKEERRMFPCPSCTKVYSHKHHLRDHMRSHSGERPYVCKLCDKAFTYASTLRNHMVIHTGEKPYICNKCHSMFSQSGTLQRHLRLIHSKK